MSNILQMIVVFLHDLFTAVWIGGLLMLTLTIFPVLKNTFGHSAESERTMDAIMQRQSKWVLISILMLAITGILQARFSGQVSGFISFNSPYSTFLSIKHILMALMVVIAFIRLRGLKKLEAAANMARKKTSLILMHINALVGVVILLLSAVITKL